MAWPFQLEILRMITEEKSYYIQNDLFLFQLQDPTEIRELVGHTKARKQIKLIPKGRSKFDFLSLLDLCEFLNDGYFATSIRSGTNGNAIFCIYNRKRFPKDYQSCKGEKLTDTWSFQININMSSFNLSVSIRQNLDDFIFDSNSELMPIIKLKRPSANRIARSLAQDSPMNRLSAFCVDKRHQIPQCIANYFRRLAKAKAHTDSNARNQYEELEELLQACPGNVHVEYLYETNDKNEKVIVGVNKMSIVFPWATKQLLQAQYLELDASFKAAKPMTYCVAQGIIHNESIPLSISITESESNELYNMVFKRFEDVLEKELKDGKILNTNSNKIQSNGSGKLSINWSEFTVLSDMGLALCSCCKLRKILHFFCHRHIIEHFGSSSPLGIFATKILACFSEESCRDIIAEVTEQLLEYTKSYIKINKSIPSSLSNKIYDLITMLELDEGDPTSNYYYERWATWFRLLFHVTRCSNHSESLHSVLNRTISSNFVTRVENLITGVLNHYSLLKDRFGKSINRKVNDTLDYIIKKLEDPDFDVFSYVKDFECKCGEDKYNETIFGSYIPCRHRILNKAFPDLVKLHGLLQANNCKLPFNACLREILSNSCSIRLLITRMFPEQMLSEDLNNALTECIKKIISSFKFPKPNSIQLDDIDFSYNEYHATFIPVKPSDKPETASEQSVPPIRLNEEVELVFDVREDQPLYEKRALRLYYETVHEIKRFYPQIKDPGMICLNKFLKEVWNLIENREELQGGQPMLQLFAKYKIQCWELADAHQHSHKFFKK